MAAISARVKAWKEAWESRDIDRVAALYAPSARHQSAKVTAIYPELRRGHLVSRDEIREYARRAFERFTELRFEISATIEDRDRAAVEYHRHSNLDAANPQHVLEWIEWRDGLITDVRVFHA